MEGLANYCIDQIRSFLLEYEYSTEDVKLLYALTFNVKIRVLFCLEEVLSARRLHAMGRPVSRRTAELLQQRGRFALNFTKLMLHCTKNRLRWNPDRIFQPNFNCVFHVHRETGQCGINVGARNECAARKIVEAYRCLVL